MTTLPTAIFVLALHILLTLLPIVAGLLVAARFGVVDRLLLLSIGLCSLMVTGYLTFWIFWTSAPVGRIFTIFLTPALVVLVICLGIPGRMVLKELGSEYLRPFLLWVSSSLLIFSFGAMYTSSPILTTSAESRFRAEMPPDNEIDLWLATALQSSHRPLPRPLYGVWYSSDRPPLQAGIYLSQEALLPGSDTQAVHYEVVGILLQGLWIFGVWGLLAAVRARARLTALVLTAVLFSGFVLVNTFYTWPKLFAAAYLALLAGVVFTPSFRKMRGSVVAGATAGALAGSAMLCHGGSALALVAFVAVLAILRRWPSKRFVLGAVALLVLTQGTWMVYQKVIDPPGDQLLREELGGVAPLNPYPRESLLTVIVSAYEKTPLGTIVSNKASNLERPFSNISSYVIDTARLVESYFISGKQGSTTRSEAARRLIKINFFDLAPSVGFISLGIVAWAAAAIRDRRKRPPPVLRLAGSLWLFLAVNIITWALILFGPGTTVIHQGTYVTELFAFTACVICLWRLSPRLCAALVFLQASLTVLLYGFNDVPDNVRHHLDGQLLALAIVGFSVTIGSLILSATERRSCNARDNPTGAPGMSWSDPDTAEWLVSGHSALTHLARSRLRES